MTIKALTLRADIVDVHHIECVWDSSNGFKTQIFIGSAAATPGAVVVAHRV
ncbi:hypothetical protein ART_0919 [Arthrobacter sp. PAMC 25486]|nr:hypothetical protein ART_0919 [Arthrobacter sp. PAMC 25486]